MKKSNIKSKCNFSLFECLGFLFLFIAGLIVSVLCFCRLEPSSAFFIFFLGWGVVFLLISLLRSF